ncbi:NAD(P)-dependent oxidoreductase, partial [Klebsiella pneumoniae]|uniref:NAD(P)-dependent oxidoreductase n=1 Tax=Klebsiella pneumoniae TaxID=573 RepID=UPI0025A0BCB1
GAAMDVMCQEPVNKDNELLTLDNCLVTPHIAWAAKEARERLMEIAVENVKGFLEGKPRNVVNV